jgi:predicted DNA-binding transcriptional regulator AlpA
MSEAYLSVKDLCRMFKASRSTLHSMRKQEDFPKPFFFGGHPRWRESEIVDWIEQQRTED